MNLAESFNEKKSKQVLLLDLLKCHNLSVLLHVSGLTINNECWN